jgi:uncharacterized protein YabE (DUF348 family)
MLTDCICAARLEALEIIKKEAKIQIERNSLKEIKETTQINAAKTQTQE